MKGKKKTMPKNDVHEEEAPLPSEKVPSPPVSDSDSDSDYEVLFSRNSDFI